MLGATLADKLIKISSICFHNVFLWSDAQVVLNWISKPPAKWTPYVANRVIKIQSLTKDYKWLHVPTKLNPADIASRGMQPNKLITCEVWWHGPAFLLMPMSQWPLQDIDFSFELCQVNTAPFEAPAPPLPLFTKFSKYNKLLRITGWVNRFITNCRKCVKDVKNSKRSALNPRLNQLIMKNFLLQLQSSTELKLWY